MCECNINICLLVQKMVLHFKTSCTTVRRKNFLFGFVFSCFRLYCPKHDPKAQGRWKCCLLPVITFFSVWLLVGLIFLFHVQKTMDVHLPIQSPGLPKLPVNPDQIRFYLMNVSTVFT